MTSTQLDLTTSTNADQARPIWAALCDLHTLAWAVAAESALTLAGTDTDRVCVARAHLAAIAVTCRTTCDTSAHHDSTGPAHLATNQGTGHGADNAADHTANAIDCGAES